MKKHDRLYNLIFPIWLLIIYPIFLPFVMVIDYGIDLFIYRRILKKYSIERTKSIKRRIGLIWAFGMLSDIIGGVLMVICSVILDEVAGAHKINYALMYNPWKDICALLLALMCMAVSSVFIFIFDYYFAFRKTSLDKKQRRSAALIFAIFTTPILFICPSPIG